MFKSLRGVNASVFFLMCSSESKSKLCSSRKACWSTRQLDPAELLPRRETENGDVDLISRSRDVDDCVWFGLEEAQDRTMSAMGKIFLGIETEYKENELDKPKRTGHARACQQSCRNGNKNSNSR